MLRQKVGFGGVRQGGNLVNFPRSINIDGCEKFLSKLADNDRTDCLDLPIGTSGYASSFGGLASAIQGVNTWARKSDGRVLLLKPGNAKNRIEEVIQRPHKFVAAMMAKSIVMGQGDELRSQVNAAAKLAIEGQLRRSFGQQRGGLCWFAFVDHSSKGFDRNFYIERSGANPEPRQPEQFKAVISAMVDKAMSVPGGARSIEPESLEYLGRIFYELFLNTHEHGSRSTTRSEWLKPGVRIIYAQGINLNEAGVRNAANQQPVLAEYLVNVSSNNPAEHQRRFVEIGIVDSGLGYCGRWLADHPAAEANEAPTTEEEYEIFKKCFRFRQTSTSKDSKGNGLPVVMDRLTKLKGFMRVRSGRLALYRDFLSSPYGLNDACVFSDWASAQSAEQVLTPMAQASGVAISLLIPLEAK